MVSLSPPSLTFDEVYDTCIFNTHKKIAYKNAKPTLSKANLNYQSCFKIGKGNEVSIQKDVNDQIQHSDLVKLYLNKMLDKKHLSRKYYDKLFNSSTICPFCGVNQVRTLEHFLPKEHYPFYSVTPLNLVPCCRDCNMGHGSTIDTTDDTTLHLHPYFDSTNSVIWLKAKIEIENNSPNFIFEVDDTCGLDAKLISRLKKHHSIFNLDLLFSQNAGTEFNGLCHYLKKTYKEGGIDDVLLSIQDHYDSYRYNKWNFWKPAFFLALHKSDWIGSGSFLHYTYD